MSLPELCIRRPVMTSLLMMSFIVFGIFGYLKLPLSALPRVDFPTVSIFTGLPAANPETMSTAVVAPLERAFAQIPGISLMTSRSTSGASNITIQFDLDRNIDGAALDVQSYITATLRRLPPQLPAPPSFKKVNPADAPVLILALSSETLPLSTVNDYAEEVFSSSISQLPGVAQVLVLGQQKFAVRIDADPDLAFARGLTLNDIKNAVVAANSATPVGGLRGVDKNTLLNTSGSMTKAEDFDDIVVAWRNGSPIHLNEIATAVDSVANDQIAAWYNDNRSIALAIFRQPDANTVDVVDQVKTNLPKYQAQLPPSIKAAVLNDRSRSVRESIDDVQATLAIAIMLVILVIFLFLKSVAATIIPSLALPVSLIGTCAFMYLFGYSIDNISLLAITLAVGFVVDDAIVMLENIVRHIEEGMKPFDAALVGSREIGYTILSITLSLVAVFIPVLLMAGVVGRVFREFAVTISCAILVSGFVSLTLTPMLCARVLKPATHGHGHGGQSIFWKIVDGAIDGLTAAYRRSLDVVLNHKFLMAFVITPATFALTIYMFINIPKGFFPLEDTGFITGSTQAAPDIAAPAMAQRQKEIVRLIRADPAVEYVTSSIGQGGTNQGSVFIALKSKKERGNIQNVINRLRGFATSVPGINAVFQPVQNLNLNGGRASRAIYQYTLQSADIKTLYASAQAIFPRLLSLPQLKDTNSDLQISNPVIDINIDRAKAGAFGLNSDQIRSALYNAYGTQQISTIFTQADDYQVILETAHRLQDDPSSLGRVYIRASAGSVPGATGSGAANAPIVPLDQVATITRSVGPLWINRQSQQPSVTISFNTTPGVAIGDAVEAIQKVERDLNLPPSITTSFTGSAALFQDAQKGQVPLIMAAVLTIYIVLGVLYESYIHPLTILAGLPSAGIGALLWLQWYGMDLSVIAIIGILLLIGIVKKNAIMMIDFALERRREGVEALPAIREAALIRFRPITMTTLAALLGAVPIAVGAGAGAELRQPLGIAIVGGLCVSQLLTLYITPVVYYYLDFIDSYISGGSKGHEVEIEPAYPPALGQAAE